MSYSQSIHLISIRLESGTPLYEGGLSISGVEAENFKCFFSLLLSDRLAIIADEDNCSAQCMSKACYSLIFICLLYSRGSRGVGWGVGCKSKKRILQKGLHIEPVKLIGSSWPQPGDLVQWQKNVLLRINIQVRLWHTSDCCHAHQNVTDLL